MDAMLEDLHQASMNGDVERVRRLLAAAPDPAALVAAPLAADNFKRTVLDSVASLPRANLEMLRLLIDCNPAAAAAQSPEGWTPLHLAVDRGSSRGSAAAARGCTRKCHTPGQLRRNTPVVADEADIIFRFLG